MQVSWQLDLLQTETGPSLTEAVQAQKIVGTPGLQCLHGGYPIAMTHQLPMKTWMMKDLLVR